ncbi:ABC transporter permease subunit [Paenibacillus beijingensis]|nr:ABC transporter permease subunit [Paenibacillus beijingensis]
MKYLFRHELGKYYYHLFNSDSSGRRWKWIYASVFAALVLITVTILGYRGNFKPEWLLFASYGFPFAAYGLGWQSIKREIERNTIGWWITLPYSRSKLLGAKYAATTLYIFALYFVYYAAVLLLAGYHVLLFGGAGGIFTDLLLGSRFFVLVIIGAIPFMVAFGVFMGCVLISKLKPLSPILWVFVGLSGNVFSWLSVLMFNGNVADFTAVPKPLSVVAYLLAAWALSALLIAASAATLNRLLVLKQS